MRCSTRSRGRRLFLAPLPSMQSIQVYDPPMCFSTSACGMDMDSDRMEFVALLAQIRTQGIKTERFILNQEPIAFEQNAAVKALMHKEGIQALPVIFWDGTLHLAGRYPTHDERAEWFRKAVAHASAAA
ncbi:MAG: hypothetical protein B7Z37_12350 [Verrucomicrobia bacterium 12-59-8]|nr:MAG: hypothetical protein B7Z37_12350 [Verrucomicrobia bacterium 12-59-8]